MAKKLAFDLHMEIIQRLGSFSVCLLTREELIHNIHGSRTIERVYTGVLDPILKAADTAYVYGIKPGSILLSSCGDILIRRKGKYEIDLSKDEVLRKRNLWDAGYGHRTCILILVRESQFSPELFKEAKDCNALTNPRSCASGSAAAYSTAKSMAKKGFVAMLVSCGSVQYVQVFLNPERLQRDFRIFCQMLHPELLTHYFDS